MALLSLQDVSLGYGGEPLLDHVTFNIERGERACLVGRNGAGKSTLMRLLAGEVEPDTGRVLRQAGLRVAYLPQEVPGDLRGPVRDLVAAGPRALAAAGDREHGTAVEAALSRLELAGEALFETLSGGQKRRVLLARALACQPDILLLDEPTNHLDIAAIEWMETFLRSRVETLLFITHDRLFLRRLARRIIDLDRGRLAGWDCDYDTFLRRKQQLLDDEAVARERMGRLLEKEEAWLRRGVRARRTRNEGRVRALLNLRDTFSRQRQEQGTSRIALQAAERSGALVLKVEGLTFAYPGAAPIIRGLDLRVLRGERIGIIGPNGSGKTTLLRLLTRSLEPAAGAVRFGTRLQVTCFDQMRATLDPEKSVAENIAGARDTVVVNGQPRHIYAYLQDYLFEPERARTPVKVLSGGERNRLLLARHFLAPGNLLAMDEPTNDLDMETLDLLEEQLAAYSGTLLLVSHDRAFLNNVVTSTLALEGDGRVAQYAGGYDDWLAQRKVPGEEPEGAPPPSGGPARAVANPEPAPARRRLGFNEKRELTCMGERIAALEQEQRALEASLQDPLAYRQSPGEVAAWQRRLAAVHAEIERLFDRWAELEALNNA
ncbi:MAG: ATP-binding cassette domain-containing protein [Lentisphaerae bacterium]|nr:ATP-binding cassette domain-containing protein [Lentisphaerota bacterium]